MSMNLPFLSALMTLTSESGTTIATNLWCQVDTVNLPWNMEVQGLVPTDWFDIYSLNWTTPVPARGQYLVDQATGTKYQVFSVVAQYIDHIEIRTTRYSGATP
jgi:hypothetical protein